MEEPADGSNKSSRNGRESDIDSGHEENFDTGISTGMPDDGIVMQREKPSGNLPIREEEPSGNLSQHMHDKASPHSPHSPSNHHPGGATAHPKLTRDAASRLGMALKASNVVGNPVTLHRIW
jgi:hypothetical protein